MLIRFWADLRSQLGTYFTANYYSLFFDERSQPHNIPESTFSGSTGVQIGCCLNNFSLDFVREYDIGAGIYEREYKHIVRCDFVGQYIGGNYNTGLGPMDSDVIYRQIQAEWTTLVGWLVKFMGWSYAWTNLPGDPFIQQAPNVPETTSGYVLKSEAPVLISSRRWVQKNEIVFMWRTAH